MGCVLLQPNELAEECHLQLADLAEPGSDTGIDCLATLICAMAAAIVSVVIVVSFTSAASLQLVPHRAHWQPTEYNALHGGMERWFDPMTPKSCRRRCGAVSLSGMAELFGRARPVQRWHIEAHQFRIDTAEGIGRPTPEGAHRDGVDYVAVILVNRLNVRGGETRVFEAEGTSGVRFTMSAPWTALLLDDAKVIHETTPIQEDGAGGVRDTLVLTFREHGFQAPGV